MISVIKLWLNWKIVWTQRACSQIYFMWLKYYCAIFVRALFVCAIFVRALFVCAILYVPYSCVPFL